MTRVYHTPHSNPILHLDCAALPTHGMDVRKPCFVCGTGCTMTLCIVLHYICCLCLSLQSFGAAEPDDGSSRWVLGWQFAAGEYLQQSKDVFGDAGIQKVSRWTSNSCPARLHHPNIKSHRKHGVVASFCLRCSMISTSIRDRPAGTSTTRAWWSTDVWMHAAVCYDRCSCHPTRTPVTQIQPPQGT